MRILSAALRQCVLLGRSSRFPYKALLGLQAKQAVPYSTSIVEARQIGNYNSFEDIDFIEEMNNTANSSSNASVLTDQSFGRFAQHCRQRYDMTGVKLEMLVSMVESGSTVPFIVRYRKFAIGNLDTTGVFSLTRDINSFAAVVKSRDAKLSKLRSDSKLTPSIYEQFYRCITMHELDEAWAPFKETKDSKISQILLINGIEKVAKEILSGRRFQIAPLPVADCKYPFYDALQHLLADSICHAPKVSDFVAQSINSQHVTLTVKLKPLKSLPPDFDPIKCKYKSYHDLSNCTLKFMKHHQILAVRRGHKEGILALSFTTTDRAIDNTRRFIQQLYSISGDREYDVYHSSTILKNSVEYAISKMIMPSRHRALWRSELQAAEEGALSVFCQNLRSLLLTPPLNKFQPIALESSSRSVTGSSVLGLDPGIGNGHKLAIVTAHGSGIVTTGRVFTNTTSKASESVNTIGWLCVSNNVKMIAIGDGVGSRDAQVLVETAMRQGCIGPDVGYAVVSEAGASVYSVSDIARDEHPETEISYLGAVSIARRLIDPLSELVKIPPASLSIGMYQHDLGSSDLDLRLSEVIQECVNGGGVNINTCSPHLLQYVAGMNASRAKALFEYRQKSGIFTSVVDIKKVKGIGEVTFKNAAGFLRVYGGLNVLDTTAIHPDHYNVLQAILKWADSSSGENNGAFSSDSEGEPKSKKRKIISSGKDKSIKTAPSSFKKRFEKMSLQEISALLEVAMDNLSNLPTKIKAILSEALIDNDAQLNLVHNNESEKQIAISAVLSDWRRWLADGIAVEADHVVPWSSDITPGRSPVVTTGADILGKIGNCEGVTKNTDLSASITAVVKNVVPFGVFVDIGYTNDGFIHKSHFVPDHAPAPPSDGSRGYQLRDIVVGQRLEVYIQDVIPPKKISLSFHAPSKPVDITALENMSKSKFEGHRSVNSSKTVSSKRMCGSKNDVSSSQKSVERKRKRIGSKN